jgi:hypothetical protein
MCSFALFPYPSPNTHMYMYTHSCMVTYLEPLSHAGAREVGGSRRTNRKPFNASGKGSDLVITTCRIVKL